MVSWHQESKLICFTDPRSYTIWGVAPANDVEDINQFIKTSQAAFDKFHYVNPRVKASLLLKWHELIKSARQDIATLICYKTGKPMAEALGEVDYALGFAWWFAGESERIRGTIAQPSVSSRRTFTLKQPIGICVALMP